MQRPVVVLRNYKIVTPNVAAHPSHRTLKIAQNLSCTSQGFLSLQACLRDMNAHPNINESMGGYSPSTPDYPALCVSLVSPSSLGVLPLSIGDRPLQAFCLPLPLPLPLLSFSLVPKGTLTHYTTMDGCQAGHLVTPTVRCPLSRTHPPTNPLATDSRTHHPVASRLLTPTPFYPSLWSITPSRDRRVVRLSPSCETRTCWWLVGGSHPHTKTSQRERECVRASKTIHTNTYLHGTFSSAFLFWEDPSWPVIHTSSNLLNHPSSNNENNNISTL